MKSAVVPASRPDRVVASPYDGRMKGKNIITNIPKPKPLALCMKLAAMVNRNISVCAVNILLEALYYSFKYYGGRNLAIGSFGYHK